MLEQLCGACLRAPSNPKPTDGARSGRQPSYAALCGAGAAALRHISGCSGVHRTCIARQGRDACGESGWGALSARMDRLQLAEMQQCKLELICCEPQGWRLTGAQAGAAASSGRSPVLGTASKAKLSLWSAVPACVADLGPSSSTLTPQTPLSRRRGCWAAALAGRMPMPTHINGRPVKTGQWTDAEDALLAEWQAKLGNRCALWPLWSAASVFWWHCRFSAGRQPF